MPRLGVITNGRPGTATTAALPGPLAHLGLGRDGAYFVIAEAAVRQFQRAHTLVPDGRVCPITWVALDAVADTARQPA